MKKFKLSEAGARGWFIGDFPEAVVRTKDFEVCWQGNPAGAVDTPHYHKVITELQLITRGRMVINGVDDLYYDHDAPSEEHEKLGEVIMLSLVPAGMTLETLWEELQETILDTYRDEAAAMLKDLKNEEDLLSGDEAIAETLELNDYEFEYSEDQIKKWPNYKSLLQSLSLEKIRNDKKQKNLPQFGIELDDIKTKGDERSD